jgi:hypothetical protein
MNMKKYFILTSLLMALSASAHSHFNFSIGIVASPAPVYVGGGYNSDCYPRPYCSHPYYQYAPVVVTPVCTGYWATERQEVWVIDDQYSGHFESRFVRIWVTH